jgi:tRNA 2-thiouridine synthesizing protein A
MEGGTVETLDVKGLACPLPVLRTKKKMRDVPAGAVLRVLATDPNSLKDMASFCEMTGNELVSSAERDGVFVFDIRRCG